MMRTLLRSIGIGCIVAGAILYFSSQTTSGVAKEKAKLSATITQLETELATTKEALAVAQTVSSSEEKNITGKETSTDAGGTELDDSSGIVKAVLIIEKGSNSASVSKSLQKFGIIENANDFNDYLAAQKAAGKIQIGEYNVDSTMNFSKLSQIITRGR